MMIRQIRINNELQYAFEQTAYNIQALIISLFI